MPRRLLVLLASALATLAAAVQAGAAPLRSDNVTMLGKIPDSAGAIGARFSADGATM
jgi:hypothetical protein